MIYKTYISIYIHKSLLLYIHNLALGPGLSLCSLYPFLVCSFVLLKPTVQTAAPPSTADSNFNSPRPSVLLPRPD